MRIPPLHGIRKNESAWSLAVSLVAGLALLLPLSAVAEEKASDPASSLFGDTTEITVGLGVAIAPRYMGADDSRVLPFPAFSLYRGIFFIDSIPGTGADSVRGIGVEYFTESHLYSSLSIGYDFGRAEEDSEWRAGSDRLKGMGEINGATTATVLLAQDLTSWLSVNGDAEFRIAGHDRGHRYRLGAETTVLRTPADEITLGINLHAGNARYNQTYFGVSETQAVRSRFSRFDADSGIYAWSLSADWIHDFNQNWTMSMGAKVMTFSNEAEDSPLVERDTAFTGFATLHYVF